MIEETVNNRRVTVKFQRLSILKAVKLSKHGDQHYKQLTEFLKTVDIFVKRDVKHLWMAFSFVNVSIEFLLDCKSVFVGNRVASSVFEQLNQTRTPINQYPHK